MIVGNFKVSWSHENNGPKRVSYTRCVIDILPQDPKEESPVARISSGVAKCSKHDTYNKALGRKLSFAVAVENIPNRETRTILWEKFKEVSPKSVAIRTHG